MIIIKHLPVLKREIELAVGPTPKDKFPLHLTYNEGMECPTFKITIEELEIDTYIDATGQKWKKVK